MKATKSGELEHRQLTLWDYPQKNTAEQESYARVCVSPRMAETDTTSTSKQEGVSCCTCVKSGSAVYRTVRTVRWEVGWSNNGQPPTRLAVEYMPVRMPLGLVVCLHQSSIAGVPAQDNVRACFCFATRPFQGTGLRCQHVSGHRKKCLV